MRKFLSLVLALFCMVPIFGGCGGPEEIPAWKVLYNNVDAFVKSDTSQFLDIKGSISYGEKLDAIISQKEAFKDYNELKSEYEIVVKLGFNYVLKNYKAFDVTPKKNKDKEMEKLLNNFQTNLEESIKTLEVFKSDKIKFEGAVTADYLAPIQLQRLLEFKRSYLNLIIKITDMAESFKNAYSYAYNDFINLVEGESILKFNGISNYMYDYVAVSILKPYYSYRMQEFECKPNSRFEFDIYKIMNGVNRETEFADEQIIKIYNMHEMLIVENKMLATSLENVKLNEIKEKYNGNLDSFFEANKLNRAYYNKIEAYMTNVLPYVLKCLEGK